MDSIWIAESLSRYDHDTFVIGPFTSVLEFENKLPEIIQAGMAKVSDFDSFCLREYKVNNLNNDNATEYYYDKTGKKFDIWERNKGELNG